MCTGGQSLDPGCANDQTPRQKKNAGAQYAWTSTRHQPNAQRCWLTANRHWLTTNCRWLSALKFHHRPLPANWSLKSDPQWNEKEGNILFPMRSRERHRPDESYQ